MKLNSAIMSFVINIYTILNRIIYQNNMQYDEIFCNPCGEEKTKYNDHGKGD